LHVAVAATNGAYGRGYEAYVAVAATNGAYGRGYEAYVAGQVAERDLALDLVLASRQASIEGANRELDREALFGPR
jgi:hypothetical protein